MKFLVLVPAFLAGSAYATCYTSGITWGSDAEDATRNAASQLAAMEFPAGTPGEEVSVTVDQGDFGATYMVQNLDGNSYALDEDFIFEYLMYEVNGCESGGDSSYDAWRFRADPTDMDIKRRSKMQRRERIAKRSAK